MAKQKQKSDVNKSQTLRDLLAENPNLSFPEASGTLAEKGIDLTKGLFYLVRKGMKSKKRTKKEKVAQGMVPSSNSADDALTTIKQIKGLATELGGMNHLKALVEALSE